MIKTEQLNKILFFQGLPPETLTKIAGIAEIETHGEEQELFKQNQNLSHFYSVLSGKIFLNSRSPAGTSITLDEVSAGHSFGLSAVTGDIETSFSAICAEKSEIIKLANDDLLGLFEKDKKLGYLIMLRVVQFFNSRMTRHTQQFVKSIANHPDIKKALAQ